MGRRWLTPDAEVRVSVADETAFGSPASNRLRQNMRSVYGLVAAHARRHGIVATLQHGPELLRQVVDADAFAAIAHPCRDAWRLRPEVLYPDVRLAPPSGLRISNEPGAAVDVSLPSGLWPGVHAAVASLAGPGLADEDRPGGEVGAFVDALVQTGLTVAEAPEPVRDPPLTFVGHNTVVIRSASTTVVVDPFLFPTSVHHPAAYQPLSVCELGPVDAVLLTHSHPDHFDLASLLRFPPTVKVITPDIERETLLSIEMVTRLRQVGFTDVIPLAWGASTAVGDVEVHALPFYGEQPTDGDVLHPEVRNEGNTYVVRTPGWSAALLADSGTDGSGSSRRLAEAWRTGHWPVDVVFSGYRGWNLYPVQLVFSSVPTFLPFVPPASWGTRQQLMNDADDALDVAERFGARYLVPYGDGGAPWYWERGLGPQLDGSGTERPRFDPFPERVVAVAASRADLQGGRVAPSPVEVLLLRPGDSLEGFGRPAGRPVLRRAPGHTWPYAPSGDGHNRSGSRPIGP